MHRFPGRFISAGHRPGHSPTASRADWPGTMIFLAPAFAVAELRGHDGRRYRHISLAAARGAVGLRPPPHHYLQPPLQNRIRAQQSREMRDEHAGTSPFPPRFGCLKPAFLRAKCPARMPRKTSVPWLARSRRADCRRWRDCRRRKEERASWGRRVMRDAGRRRHRPLILGKRCRRRHCFFPASPAGLFLRGHFCRERERGYFSPLVTAHASMAIPARSPPIPRRRRWPLGRGAGSRSFVDGLLYYTISETSSGHFMRICRDFCGCG